MVNHRGDYWSVENLRLMTLPASPPPIYMAAGAKLSAASAGQIGDGLIGVSPNANVIDVFRGNGGADKPCIAQLHVSIAATVDAATDNAWTWWPNAVVPSSVLSELAKPQDFEAIADAIGPAGITDVVVCATDSEPIIEAIDRFAGAGFDTVYLHQVGPDQQRLADLAASELLPHYHHVP
jgi:G6PDH family F420-dependent oxidoreductase